jgi:hypothetical protein
MQDCDPVKQATVPEYSYLLWFIWWVFFIETGKGWYPFALRRPCAEDQNRQLIPPVSP